MFHYKISNKLFRRLCHFLVDSCDRKRNGISSNRSANALMFSTDLLRTEEHEEITWDLILLIGHDPQLKQLLEKSIQKAHEINPDPDTNPIDSLESYYCFIDRIVKAMPWCIVPSDTYSSLYDRINQGMGLLYFVCNQPLEELSDKEYFHHSLQYHEPFRSWWIKLLSVNGAYLDTEESWNEEYYQLALKNPDFHLDDDTFEDPSNWHSFNDFFGRALKDPDKRPITICKGKTCIL